MRDKRYRLGLVVAAVFLTGACLVFVACGGGGDDDQQQNCSSCSLSAETFTSCLAETCAQQCSDMESDACFECADQCDGCGGGQTCAECSENCAENAPQRCAPRDAFVTCSDGVY